MTRFGRILVLIAGATVAGCGRREAPAWFDAQPPRAAAAAGEKPLPASALKVRWASLSLPRTVGANTIVPIIVSFTNAGNMLWPDVAAANPRLKDGSYAVRLSYEWIPAGDPHDDRRRATRSDLPRSMMPGDSVNMRLTLQTPAEAGEYTVVIELVQELVQWFADHGAERIMLPVRVVPAGAAPADTRSAR